MDITSGITRLISDDMTIPYTPAGAVTANSIVIKSGRAYFAPRAIAAGTKDALITRGVIECGKDTAGGAISDGAKVWCATASGLMTDSTSAAIVAGRAVGDSASGVGTIVLDLTNA